MILEPIWEADFSTHSYGFRPNRSTYDAMTSDSRKPCMLLKIGDLPISAFVNITPIESMTYAF